MVDVTLRVKAAPNGDRLLMVGPVWLARAGPFHVAPEANDTLWITIALTRCVLKKAVS